MEEFNLEAVYDEQISPLMEKIIAICQKNHLPMLAVFAYGYHADDETSETCQIAVMLWPERTPASMYAALEAVQNPVQNPVNMLAFAITTNSFRGPDDAA